MKDEKPPLGMPNTGTFGVATQTSEPHPAGRVRYGRFRQVVRMCSFVLYFFLSVNVILVTQLVGAPLYFIDKPTYYAWMARTKQHFGVLVTTFTQWWSPTIIRVTGDRTVRHQLTTTSDGRLECKFPERIVLIANHQLYSDWLYLWWIAYTARMHGFIYIILKESLKWIPWLGLGMQFYGFIFLARKWEQDKPRFIYRLSKLAANGRDSPMWLMIYPEGTNLSDNGRKASSKYAEKIGIQDMRHLILPRATGLRFCLEQMKDTVDWVYDCTVAYEGIPRGKFGQDFFTLYSTYFQGRPPKSVNMHWRRFAISSIPIDDPVKFELWLRDRWREKDNLMEHYMQTGRFPEDNDTKNNKYDIRSEDILTSGVRYRAQNDGRKPQNGGDDARTKKWEGPIETEVKLARWSDVLDIWVVAATVLLLANIVTKSYRMVVPSFMQAETSLQWTEPEGLPSPLST